MKNTPSGVLQQKFHEEPLNLLDHLLLYAYLTKAFIYDFKVSATVPS